MVSHVAKSLTHKFFLDALLNPATALESTVQDFLDSFGATPEAASADLINCVFRVCGCNSSVDSDQVMDSDGVVDFLGDVVEEIKGVRIIGFYCSHYPAHAYTRRPKPKAILLFRKHPYSANSARVYPSSSIV